MLFYRLSFSVPGFMLFTTYFAAATGCGCWVHALPGWPELVIKWQWDWPNDRNHCFRREKWVTDQWLICLNSTQLVKFKLRCLASHVLHIITQTKVQKEKSTDWASACPSGVYGAAHSSGFILVPLAIFWSFKKKL